jgi:hypothetical protein
VIKRPLPDGVSRWLLSVRQQGVYFQWRLAPDNPYYSYQGVLRLRGSLDLSRLGAAWEALLAENPALLGRFDDQGDEPFQEPEKWQCPLGTPLDFRTIPTQEREETFRMLTRAEAQIPFDLAHQPALRACLMMLTDDEHRLLMTMHEILLDGWGAMVLFSRLAELYAGSDEQLQHKSADFAAYCSGRQIISALRTSLELPSTGRTSLPRPCQFSNCRQTIPAQPFRLTAGSSWTCAL